MEVRDRMKAVLMVAALFCCMPMAAAAEDKPAVVPPSGIAPCDLAAWITKGAPADLALRAGPGPDHPPVATVPGPYSDGQDTYFPEVKITGSRDGWFRITEIVTDLYGGLPTDPVTAFKGEGWLPGSVLRLWVESRDLQSGPSPDSPIAFTLDQMQGTPADGNVEALLGCKGAWVEVEMSQSGARTRGWTADVCASQVTTCP